jgi:hypothetical protein
MADRRALLRALVALPFLAPGPGATQQADGPRARFDDDLVSRLEGDWQLTRAIRGTEVRNRVVAKWVLNHQFLELRMKDVKEPPAYEAIVLIGYLHATKQYVAHWCDTYGGLFSARGLGVRNGNSVEFRFDYPDAPFFNTFTWKPESGQWVFRMESQDTGGSRRLFAVDTLVRE